MSLAYFIAHTNTDLRRVCRDFSMPATCILTTLKLLSYTTAPHNVRITELQIKDYELNVKN